MCIRDRLYAAIDRALDQGSRRQVDREQGQSRLFGGDAGGDEDELPALAAATPWSDEEMLRGEKEALGLYLSGHPLERHAEGLKAAGALTSTTLATVQSGGDGTMAGIIGGCRIVKTRKGDRMAVFMLEDQVGSVEVVVYPEPYKQFASICLLYTSPSPRDS